MTGYAFAIGLCAFTVLLLFYLLRTRRIREKYAGVWVLLAIAVILLGAFPQLAFWVSDLLGVEAPVNLLFATAFVVLLAVCLQLSSEVSHLEEETRVLAEEIALLRYEVRADRAARGPRGSAAAGADSEDVDQNPDTSP